MPRIIAGECGGLIIKAPQGRNTRPSADKTKEAIFSSLQSRLSFEGIAVLDLFAGSAALGLEALSRGGDSLVAVEQNSAAVAIIKQNTAICKMQDRVKIMPVDYRKALEQLVAGGHSFDLIMLDPPYVQAEAAFQTVAGFCRDYNLLRSGGILVLESSSTTVADLEKVEFNTSLELIRRCKYGAAMVSFYR